LKFTVVSLFPDLIESVVSHGLIGQAREKGGLQIETRNPRQYTSDVHHTVDDRAFGGGDGMVMKVEPLAKAVTELRAAGAVRVVVLTPQGRIWNQALARDWATEGTHTVLICGRYAGIDHRFTMKYADEEISLGDFILNGGEVAACAVIESVARLLPLVLGNEVSALKDSFSDGLLECPQFTRPRDVEGMPVPSPLLSGHHEKIREFEGVVGLLRTMLLRPDLISVPPQDLERKVKLVSSLPDAEIHALGFSRSDLAGLLA
jgi:tRNA (guanine37-N1)-methyltransferase